MLIRFKFFASALLIFFISLTMPLTMAQTTDTQTQIYDHDTFSLSIPSALTRRNSTPELTDTVTISAFGQIFTISLESNDHLFAHLPQQQKQRLSQALKLYRGTVVDAPGSWVRLTQHANGLFSGMIWDGVELYMIDPVENVAQELVTPARRASGESIIYRLSDTDMGGITCALEPDTGAFENYRKLGSHLHYALSSVQANTLSQLDLAIVADTQFVNNNSNPEAAVIARMNVVDGIFTEQVGVRLNIAELQLLSNNGNLTSTAPGDLLNQFRSYANSSSLNNPGLAHLFTARNLNGSVVGIAYVSALCKYYGVGVSEVIGSGTSRALVVAHELGHNFGAPHDNQSGSACSSTPNGYIMNPSINGSDQFSQCSINQMQSDIAVASCITEVDPPDPVSDLRLIVPTNPLIATVGDDFNYALEIDNSGPDSATGVSVSIDLPAAVTVTQAENCSQDASGTWSCNLADIANGARSTLNLSLQALTAGHFDSSATVFADYDDNNQNDSVSVAIQIDEISNEPVLLSADFDSGKDGFTYLDDAFGTNQRRYAKGLYKSDKGYLGSGALWVTLGGRDDNPVSRMSGAWQHSFALNSAAPVTLTFRYRLGQTPNYENNEYSDILIAVDDVQIGVDGNSYIDRIYGNGNGGSSISTGWQQISIDLGTLTAGTHTLSLGGYNNKKNAQNEKTVIRFDDILIEAH